MAQQIGISDSMAAQLVQLQMLTGQSAGAVIGAALAREMQYWESEQLRAAIQVGVNEIELGEYTEYASAEAMMADVMARVRGTVVRNAGKPDSCT